MKIWLVPVSKHTPHGYKYSLVYIVKSNRVIGYDNERGKGDHRHVGRDETPYAFMDVRQLVEDFRRISRPTRRNIVQVKQVKIGIRSVDEAFENFTATGEAIERGEVVKKQPARVYFPDLDAFRKALTQKRLELLHVIRKEKPKSIHELARLVNRDIKNVSTDVKYLSQIGLVELKEENNRLFPSVNYRRIQLDIAV